VEPAQEAPEPINPKEVAGELPDYSNKVLVFFILISLFS
jgi:hypothetical protein